MAKDLTPSKLSSLAKTLSGKEAALLVIDYHIRGEKEKKDYSDEVKTISSTITYSDTHRRQEYIFYHDMWRNCGFYSLDLQTSVMNLEIYAWKLEAIKQVMYDNGFKYMLARFMNMLPRYLTQKQFDELYLKCREKMLAEQLPVECVAQYEAFQTLKKERLVPENVHLGVDDVFSGNQKLEDTFDEYTDKTVKVLEADFKKGLLKEIKVRDKAGWYHNGEEYIGSRGISGDSWYKYDKKLDTGYNEMIDDKGKLVEFYEGEVAIAQGMAANMSAKDEGVCWGEHRRKDMIESIQKDLSLDFDVQDKLITFDELFDPMLQTLTEWTNDCTQQSINIWEVLKKAQREVFDDKIELDTFLADKAKESIKRPKEVMDSLLEHIKDILNFFSMEDRPKIKNEDKYQIITDPKPDETFVEEQFRLLIGMAEKESGYKYKM